jgi:hypothetical protein
MQCVVEVRLCSVQTQGGFERCSPAVVLFLKKAGALVVAKGRAGDRKLNHVSPMRLILIFPAQSPASCRCIESCRPHVNNTLPS